MRERPGENRSLTVAARPGCYSVFRYSITARRSASLSRSPYVWPPLPRPGFGLAAWLQCVGAALFSGSLFALAFGGPAWLGAVTPAGGVGMILGFALLAWTAWRG